MRPLPGLAAAAVLLWGCGPAAPRTAATPVPEASATAATDGLRAVFEEVADRDLGRFFQQWLRAPGYPVLSVSTRDLWTGLRVEIEQVQGDYAPRFHIPVDVEVTWDDRSVRATVPLEGAGGVWIVPGAPADARVTLDPDGWLLHRLHGSPPTP